MGTPAAAMFLLLWNCFNIDSVRMLLSTLFPVPAATGYSLSFFYHRKTKPNFIQPMHLIWKMFSLSVPVSPEARTSSEFLWMYKDVKLNSWCIYPLPLFTLFIIPWIIITKWCPGYSSPNPSSHKQLHYTTLLINQYPKPQVFSSHCIQFFDS